MTESILIGLGFVLVFGIGFFSGAKYTTARYKRMIETMIIELMASVGDSVEEH